MHFLLFLAIFMLANILPSSQNVGYIGPACAVVENSLFLHGMFVRKLEPPELVEFYKYEGALGVLRQLHEALAAGSASVSPNSSLLLGPEVPQFCNGLDGTLEVVLNGCIVRKNHVYMAGRIVRPLSTLEKKKIDALIHRSAQSDHQMLLEKLPQKMRTKRQNVDAKSNKKANDDPILRPQRDIANLLGHFLHINESVAQRFIPPMAAKSQSPLLDRLNGSLVKAWEKEIADSIRQNRRRNSLPIENLPQQNEQQKPSTSAENHLTHLRGRRFLSPTNSVDFTAAHLIQPNGDSIPSSGDFSQQNAWIGQPQHFPQQNLNFANNAQQANLFSSPIQPIEGQILPSLSAFQPGNPQYAPAYSLPMASFSQQSTFPPLDGGIKPGESVILGGQTYVAVPMSSLGMGMPQSIAQFGSQTGQQQIIGLMPTFSSGMNPAEGQQSAAYSNAYQQPEGATNFWPSQTADESTNYQGQNFQQQQPQHFASYPNNQGISSYQNQQMPQQFEYYHQQQPSASFPYYSHYFPFYGYAAKGGNAQQQIPRKSVEEKAEKLEMELPDEICQIPPPF